MKRVLQECCLQLAMYTSLPGSGFGVDQGVLEAGASWDHGDISGHSLPFWLCPPWPQMLHLCLLWSQVEHLL